MKKLLLFSCCIFAISIFAFSQQQIEWQKSLGGSNDDFTYCVKETRDSGYIIAGGTLSNDGDVSGNHGGFDYWIVKLNSNGTINWQKCFGGSFDDFPFWIEQTADGGYILAGYSLSNNGDVSGNHGGSDYWVVKLNSDGTINWQKCYGGSGNDFARVIKETSDGGYILAGSSHSNDGDVSGNNGYSDFWIVKLNTNGIIQWQKCYGGTDYEYLHTIKETNDDGYILAGYSLSNDGDVSGNHGGFDYWIVKLNTNGTIQWQKSLGGSSHDCASSALPVTDGYMVTGYSMSNDGDVSGNHGSADYWIVKLNTNGTIQWQKSLGGSGYDCAYDIKTASNGYIIIGESNSNDGDISGNHGGVDYWIVKLNTNGTIQWQKPLGGSSHEYGYYIEQTTTGYILAGDSKSNDGDVSGNHGSADYWIVSIKDPTLNIQSRTDQTLTIYPNPANEKTYLNFPMLQENTELIVMNAFGEIVYSDALATGISTYVLPTQFTTGIYVVMLKTGTKTISSNKLIIY